MSAQLLHLNDDTSWLLTLPTTPPFRLLIDPWFIGSQTDYSSLFSRQHHVTPSLCLSIPQVPGGVDGVLVAHEFTDHCHEATFRTLAPAQAGTNGIPVWAVPNAKRRIESWKLLADPVAAITPSRLTLRELGRSAGWAQKKIESVPDDVSAMYVDAPGRWDPAGGRLHGITLLTFPTPVGQRAIGYAPHGTAASAAARISAALGSVPCIALLHGFDHIQLPLFGEVNFGLQSAAALVKEMQPTRWIRTHDEPKRAEGVVGRMLKLDRQGVAAAEKVVGDAQTVAMVLACGESVDLLAPIA
ncbi:hypothetical protein C8J57DRAFT_1113835 [Mycena rebaudengoi]|nr:hypothetical protein C8J57DRAFT_1113835 [Mycena rebaudengoi]